MVVAKLGYMQGILGMRFLQRENSSIDAANGNLTCGNVQHRLHHVQSHGCSRVCLADSTTLGAREETLVYGCLESPGALEGIAMLEPSSPDIAALGILIPQALVQVGKGRIAFTIVNLDEELSLLPGTPIAKVTPAEEVSAPIFPWSRGLPSPETRESPSCCGGNNPGEPNKALVTTTEGDVPDDNTVIVPEHLQNLYERAIPDLTESQAKELAILLCDQAAMFMAPDGQLGRTPLVKHEIHTGEAPPIKMGPRRQGPFLRKVTEELVNEMLRDGIVRPSTSPWSCPVVLSKKKDGSFRFCADYRGLNDVTRKDAYPLPNIHDCIDSLSGSKCFCTLDLASGYWQVEMEETSKPKTAFVTHQGLFEFKVMPFGLTNAPATFERLMEVTLSGLQWQECLIFLDDIVVFGESFQETKERLLHVLDRFREAGLKLKPSKCSLFQREVAFLGHVVTEQGVKCDPRKIESVVTWPRPKNVTEVRSYLGFCSYYRRFVKSFSTIAAPLTALTEKGRKFEWSNECQNAFQALQEALTCSPVLAYPDSSLESPMVLDTDCSNFGMGGVLSQVQGGVERVIAYASKTLSATQRVYCVTYKELLAVVTMVKHWRHYLLGRHFKIRSDHASLKWLTSWKDLDSMPARWMARLGSFDFHLEHRKGTAHGNADGLSRRPLIPCKRACPRPDCPDCTRVIGPIGPPVTFMDPSITDTVSSKEETNGSGTETGPLAPVAQGPARLSPSRSPSPEAG
jgi:hypothetical protein